MQNIDYRKLIQPDLKSFETRFSRSLRSGSKYIGACVAHAGKNKGKRIRPALLFLAGRACGALKDAHTDAAVALELFHTATLLHDDVIDEADLRRGAPTHNGRFGNAAAVIFGDYILSCALAAAASEELFACRGSLTDAAKKICEGEVEQVFRRFDLAMTEEDYIRIIRNKTAILFAAGCEIGAALAGADEHLQKSLYDYGMELGIAFQIMDDLTDVFGNEKDAGKSLRSDLRKGELTLPFIRLGRSASYAKRVRAIVAPERIESSMRELLELLYCSDAFDYCLALATARAAAAKNRLSDLADSPAKRSLIALADRIVHPGKLRKELPVS
jgi:octaprenyl-diphosphate synthase